MTGTDFAAYEISSWCQSYFVLALANFLLFVPTQFILFNCLALFLIFNYLAKRCPPKKNNCPNKLHNV